jgi:flagellar protein FlbD
MVEQMIVVSRLNGERFGINAEHIERVEETPDTVLTLLDGKKYIVQESLSEVLDLVVSYRARILHISYSELPPPTVDEVGLHLVKDDEREPDDDPTEDGRRAGLDQSLETH